MATVCPTVTAENLEEYEKQLKRLEPFAGRIHLDFMDGLFTKNRSLPLETAKMPENTSVKVDLHLMYMRPDLYLEQIQRFTPNLVVVQAEAKGDFANLADSLHQSGVKIGVALLQETPVDDIAAAIADIDHVLIFSGHLGYFGGQADLSLLDKVKELRNIKPGLEIAWDGGINAENAPALVTGGVDVLNVGGFIQQADDPASAYAKLIEVVENR